MAGFDFSIVNVVAFAELGVSIPLDKLSYVEEKGKGYEPEQSKGIVYRPEGIDTAALILPGGKVICTGAKSVKDVEGAVRKVVERMRGMGIQIPDSFRVEIESIAARSGVKGPVDLKELSPRLKEGVYRPDEFPGIVWRLEDPEVVVSLLGSGKMLCTGARSVGDAKKAFKKVTDMLKKAGFKSK